MPGLKEEEAADGAGHRGRRSGRSQRPRAMRHAGTAAVPLALAAQSSRLPRCWGPRAPLRVLLSLLTPPSPRSRGRRRYSTPPANTHTPGPAAVTLASAGPTPYRLQRDPWWLGGPLQPSGFSPPSGPGKTLTPGGPKSELVILSCPPFYSQMRPLCHGEGPEDLDLGKPGDSPLPGLEPTGQRQQVSVLLSRNDTSIEKEEERHEAE